MWSFPPHYNDVYYRWYSSKTYVHVVATCGWRLNGPGRHSLRWRGTPHRTDVANDTSGHTKPRGVKMPFVAQINPIWKLPVNGADWLKALFDTVLGRFERWAPQPLLGPREGGASITPLCPNLICLAFVSARVRRRARFCRFTSCRNCCLLFQFYPLGISAYISSSCTRFWANF